MKTYTIKNLLKKELLIIETPLNVKDVIFNKGDNSLTWETEHLIISGYDLDDYTLLGSPEEISEEDAMGLVELFSIQSGGFKDYLRPECGYKTATESLLSAIESVIFWENPYKIYDSSTWNDVSKEYDAAELRTFDRNRTIIFYKTHF